MAQNKVIVHCAIVIVQAHSILLGGLRGHIPAGFHVIPQQKNAAGLVWTGLLFALWQHNAGEKPMPQHTHAVTWLPLLARGQAKNLWKLGLIETYSLSSFLLLILLHSEQDERRDS